MRTAESTAQTNSRVDFLGARTPERAHAPGHRRAPWAPVLAMTAALAGCGDSGAGGSIDLGEPQAGADDAVATAACALLDGTPTAADGAANGADAPLLNIGEAYLVEPVPAGTAFVRFEVPAGTFRGGFFVRPSESLLSARQGRRGRGPLCAQTQRPLRRGEPERLPAVERGGRLPHRGARRRCAALDGPHRRRIRSRRRLSAARAGPPRACSAAGLEGRARSTDRVRRRTTRRHPGARRGTQKAHREPR
jgi:hypothetical protein